MNQPYAITPLDIEVAAECIAGHVLRTPLIAAPRLSELVGAEVLVKHENMQATASFKAEAPDLDVLIIPVGGGGLMAGNAIAAGRSGPISS